jgi:hypothetical protein
MVDTHFTLTLSSNSSKLALMTQGGQRYRLAKQVRLSVNGDSGVILDVVKGKYYGLSPVATTICLHLQVGTSVSQLLDVLAVRYAVPKPQLLNDIQDFVAVLSSAGMCEPAHEASMDCN